jgi:hypothetical protein
MLNLISRCVNCGGWCYNAASYLQEFIIGVFVLNGNYIVRIKIMATYIWCKGCHKMIAKELLHECDNE